MPCRAAGPVTGEVRVLAQRPDGTFIWRDPTKP